MTAANEVSPSPQGRVEANIQAESITLAGQVKGNLVAKSEVSLPADSRLDGNIEGHNVHVGGVVKGDVVGRGKVELGPPRPRRWRHHVEEFGDRRGRGVHRDVHDGRPG